MAWAKGGVALAALVIAAAAGAPASAQSAGSPQDTAALEARIAQLEAALVELRAEMAASRAQPAAAAASPAPDVIRLEGRPTSPPAPPAPPANGFRMGDQTLTFGGFIKADVLASRYDGGDPANGDALRDFYLPGAIPVGGADEGTALDFNARQTRLWLAAQGRFGERTVGGRVEMDFQVLPGAGDQRTTSPANLSLRRAFVTIDGWLIGQEWTNFQNLSVLPESADYVGVSEGTVFARQAQIRWTRGPLSISVENPETTVTPLGGGARIVADDNALPDLTARWTRTGPWGEVSIAGLARSLAYESPVAAIDATATGWGVSAAARLKVGARDDVRAMLTVGEGIGRYVGLNFSNDAVLTATGDLETIGITAGFLAYRRVWSDAWRSNLVWSAQQVDNTLSLTGASANDWAQSLRANLIWTPVRPVDIGLELMRGERELQSGASGELTRLQGFVKYGF
ncbi:MAG TPA: DcaP family trimeric outer membrane transporter [Brevundimonas sp.]|jgi:hypothetical protein|uniref:DcaP family trimeric outer membrane transporter n=1 Tax=Brevundimonas sp. TaxID=1871086 RepID=UPI002E159A8B|nr:DcaP family trimeric outer membrane transporter [Brevundimonas sp.]